MARVEKGVAVPGPDDGFRFLKAPLTAKYQ